MRTTWREMIFEEMQAHGESFNDVIENTMTAAEMNVKFDSGYGGSNGIAFTVWTHKRVYFPAVYDGAEWVASVSRFPDFVPTYHIGGE